MSDFDEFYGDDGNINAIEEADSKKVNRKLYNDGYRDGKAAEEERLVQCGFDHGFEKGIKIGMACGSLLAQSSNYFKQQNSGLDSKSLGMGTLILLNDYLKSTFIDDFEIDGKSALFKVKNMISADSSPILLCIFQQFSDEICDEAGAAMKWQVAGT